MNGMRRRALVLGAGAVLALGGGIAPAAATPSTAERPFCGQVWGSLPESYQTSIDEEVVTDVRAGRHACFDRLVIDLRGPADQVPAYDVRYVDMLSAQGSGSAIPLRGGAALRVLVGAPAYSERHQPTYLPADRSEVIDVRSFDTFRQVAWAGSFEGQTSLGIGTRARLPFRVFALLGEPGSDRATRLVVDVAHHW